MAMSEARSGPSSQRRGPLGELGAEYHGELGHGGLLAGITAGLGTMMQEGSTASTLDMDRSSKR